MNREDIIRMAREAGITESHASGMFGFLERFAALVAAAERERIYFETSSDFVKSAVAAEREACAKVCEALWLPRTAAAIRARGDSEAA